MAKDAENHINYYLCVSKTHEQDLGNIRHWEHLKVAFEEEMIWIKDFDYVQINDIAVKSIPFKTIFYTKEGKLYLLDSLLPERNIPSVLWTPISRALSIELPDYNHNYFGIEEQLHMQLIPSEKETVSTALMISMDNLGQYIKIAPSLRLEILQWVILNNDKVLLIGTPLLPISGQTYWLHHDFLIPAGYDFELPSLTAQFAQKINSDKKKYILWNTNNSWIAIPKQDINQLTRTSFHKTEQRFSQF